MKLRFSTNERRLLIYGAVVLGTTGVLNGCSEKNAVEVGGVWKLEAVAIGATDSCSLSGTWNRTTQDLGEIRYYRRINGVVDSGVDRVYLSGGSPTAFADSNSFQKHYGEMFSVDALTPGFEWGTWTCVDKFGTLSNATGNWFFRRRSEGDITE